MYDRDAALRSHIRRGLIDHSDFTDPAACSDRSEVVAMVSLSL